MMKTICNTCEKFKRCNAMDRCRGQACTDYKKGKEKNERAR